ncbi:GLUTAMYL TRNA SYNTHETASE (FRAGMENT) (GLUTAMATE--TRNA LIGASE) (GLURS) [Mycoplasmopsis pulmonis]|uniref:Uncharacterized protein MYPU_6810 n=1 Tax=Mycoplasmopsis pulmonis (strain UAB CTIP) TaxID=272635 RepID=Y681_MYCPU
MKIEFNSEFTQEGQEKNINFVSPVEISEYEGATVYEFSEPSKEHLSRIEINSNSNEVLIITDSMTMILKLNEEVENAIALGQGKFFLKSLLNKLEHNDSESFFAYVLKDTSGNELACFKITLKIFE